MDVRFWQDARGREPVREYLVDLERHGERGALVTYRRIRALLEDSGPALGMPYTRLIERRQRVHEMHVGSHRIAYVESEGAVVLLHAWRKRSQKLDATELAVALARLRGQEGT